MTDEASPTTTTWRRLLRSLALAYPIAVVVITAAAWALGQKPTLFILVPALLFVPVAFWLNKVAGRGPVIAALVVAVLNLLATFWLVFSLAQVTSPLEFLLGAAFTLCVLPAIGVAIAALRRGGAPGGRRTRIVLVSLAGLAVVGAAIGGLTAPDEDAAADDLVVVAKNFEFEPSKLSAPAGSVSFYVDNKDVVAHDIGVRTKEGEDEKTGEVAPGKKGARSTFDLAAGSYEYFCSFHTEMTGRLTVT